MTVTSRPLALAPQVALSLALLFAGLACAPHERRPEPVPVTPAPSAGKPPPPVAPFDRSVHAGDRLLFVGDELTQQMFYTRAVAAGLLAMRPRYGLRVLNGGREGATVQSTLDWIDDLLEIAQPQVVFLCLGLNDATGKAMFETQTEGPRPEATQEAIVTNYRRGLEALIERVQRYDGVRQVVVLTAPSMQSEPGDPAQGVGVNHTLWRLSQEAMAVAQARGAGYIDLFEPTHLTYATASSVGGKALTLGGRLPTEPAHVVIANVVFYGLGVEAHEMDAVAWSPISAREMGRVRGVFPLELRQVTPEDANLSRGLYESIRNHDELFFRAWRLAGRGRNSPSRAVALEAAQDEWVRVQSLAVELYGSPRPPSHESRP